MHVLDEILEGADNLLKAVEPFTGVDNLGDFAIVEALETTGLSTPISLWVLPIDISVNF